MFGTPRGPKTSSRSGDASQWSCPSRRGGAAAVALVNRIAAEAELANHHPDILIHGYQTMRIGERPRRDTN
jgi:hypothetical protein